MKLAKLENNKVVDVIIADSLIEGYEEVESSVGIGFDKVDDTFVDNRPKPEPARKIIYSKFTFKKRFSFDEWGAIKASEDPVIQDFVETFQIADYIDVDHEDLIAALEYMEQSILVEGRADEIRGL